MIPNRAPGVIWMLRRDAQGPYVHTGSNEHIVIAGADWVGQHASLYMSRKDARLLAKRINQCLDFTAKK